MKKRTAYIDFRALFLAVLIFLAFGAKEIHHVFQHSHQEVKICDVKIGETHLHDESYITDECQLCDFTFSVFDLTVPVFTTKSVQNCLKTTIFSYISFKYSNRYLFQSLRAPPFLGVV